MLLVFKQHQALKALGSQEPGAFFLCAVGIGADSGAE
jgi:hypothetical protein